MNNHQQQRRGLLVAIGCAGAGLARAAHASDLPGLEEALRRTRQVVVARCLEAVVKPLPQYGGNPFTFYRFAVEQTVRGSLQGEFTLRLFGGRIGDTTVSSEHIPQFTSGRTYLLFLGDPNRDGFAVPTGEWLFEVVPDADGRRRRLLPIAGGTLHGQLLEPFVARVKAARV